MWRQKILIDSICHSHFCDICWTNQVATCLVYETFMMPHYSMRLRPWHDFKTRWPWSWSRLMRRRTMTIFWMRSTNMRNMTFKNTHRLISWSFWLLPSSLQSITKLGQGQLWTSCSIFPNQVQHFCQHLHLGAQKWLSKLCFYHGHRPNTQSAELLLPV